MKVSELTLEEILPHINNFAPIKVTFNDIVLYNDYNSTYEIMPGIYGEEKPLLAVVPLRIRDFNQSIVSSIDIEIVDFHHSIVKIQGELRKMDDSHRLYTELDTCPMCGRYTTEGQVCSLCIKKYE